MTKRAPHPALAAFYRAGGAVTRAAAVFARAEDAGAFADMSLEAHPLIADPSFQDLLAGQGALQDVNGALAKLAKDQGAANLPALRRTQSATDTASVVLHAPHIATEANRAPQQRAAMTGAPASQRAKAQPLALKAIERALRQIDGATAETRATHPVEAPDAARKMGLDPSGTAPKASWTPRERMTMTAAQQPVARPISPAQRAAVTEILQGKPVSVPEAHMPDTTPGLSAHAARIEQALSKLSASSTPSPSSARSTPRDAFPPAAAPIHVAPSPAPRARPQPTAQTSVAQASPAPRNGIERLLQKARQQNLIPDGQAEGAQAPLSTEPADRPDLKTSQRPAPKAEPAPALSPESLAEAMTDLIRREARAAGIDLNGGRK